MITLAVVTAMDFLHTRACHVDRHVVPDLDRITTNIFASTLPSPSSTAHRNEAIGTTANPYVMASRIGNLPLCKYRYALFVSYYGTRYNGSQRLIARGSTGEQDTIQEALEVALENFLPEKRCRLTAASRTDKGVHALINVWTLPLMDYGLPTETVKSRVNKNLALKKHDILVNEVVLVPASFHPRNCVASREYIYRIAVPGKYKDKCIQSRKSYQDYLGDLPLSELYRVLPVPTIDLDKTQEAIDVLHGEHDFAAFAGTLEHNPNTRRKVEIDLIPEQPPLRDDTFNHTLNDHMKFYRFHIKSRAFLHNQVRRMVGTILAYATFNHIKLADIRDLIDNPSQENWRSKIKLAEPFGLYLYRLKFIEQEFDGSIKTHEDNTEELVGNTYCENKVFGSDDGEKDQAESNKQSAVES